MNTVPQAKLERLPLDQELSPLGDALRYLRHGSDTLALAREDRGHSELLHWAEGRWRWAAASDAALRLHFEALDAFWDRAQRAARESRDQQLFRRQVSWYHRSNSADGFAAMIKAAGAAHLYGERHYPDWPSYDPETGAGVRTVSRSELDPLHCLGVANGVVDLRTGRLLRADQAKSAMMTRHAPTGYYPTAAETAIVNQLLAPFGPDAYWLLNLIGRSLRGERDKHFLLIWGQPNSGKTTLLEALRAVFGAELTVALSDGALAPERGGRGSGRATPELAKLEGKRLAFAPEAGSWRIDAERVKAFTGEDTITARLLRENEHDFVINALLIMTGNSVPRLRLEDQAVADRLLALEQQAIPLAERWTGERADRPNLATAIRSDSEPAAQARADLLRRIIEAGQADRAPLPESVQAAIATAIAQDVPEALAWIRENVQRSAEPSEVVLTDELWESLRQALPDGEGVRGYRNRQSLSRAAVGELGSLSQIKSDGRVKRGWRGWRLTDGEAPFE